MARRSTVAALGTLAVVVLVVVTGPALVGPALDRTGVGTMLCDGATAAAAGDARVGLVIDRGAAGGGVSVQCVSVADRSSGFELLRAGGHSFRLNSAGLTCAIDGVPETGCGERTANGYRYWAYFHGRSGAWSYASDGPAVQRLGTGAVEGWHFVEGTGRPDDPPPAGPADPTVICRPVSPPTAPVANPATPPSSTPTGAGAPSTGDGPGPAPPLADAGQGTAPNGGAGSAAEPVAGDDPSVPGGHGGGAGAGAGGQSSSVAETGDGAASADDATANAAPPGGEVAAVPLRATSDTEPGSSTPWPAVAVGVAVLGLGVVATRRFRLEREQ
jgi:hypothetical protein